MRLDIAWINSVAALGARQHRSKVVPTTPVSVKKRRPFLSREVLITPMHKPDQDRVKAQAFLGQAILEALRRLLVSHFRENIVFHQMC